MVIFCYVTAVLTYVKRVQVVLYTRYFNNVNINCKSELLFGENTMMNEFLYLLEKDIRFKLITKKDLIPLETS